MSHTCIVIISVLLLFVQLYGIGKQHREVQGSESKLFKSYFDEINILEGG